MVDLPSRRSSRAPVGARLLSLVAAVVIGCGSPALPSESAEESRSPTQIPPTPTEASRASPTPLTVELHELDPRFVPDALRSSGGQALWASGEGGADTDIWRYVPGAPEPELLFTSPRGDAVITDVVAATPGYAFVEMSKAFGEGGWRIWFLPASGGEPMELDRGQAPGSGAAPTIAMDDHWIAWAAFDEPESGPVSVLRVVPIGDLADVATLIHHPIGEGLLWFPAINGEELWYAIIHADFEGTGPGDEFHLEWLTLADPSAPATRFAGTANDFNPAVNDHFVVWKTAEGDSAALNWGTMHVLDRQTGSVAAASIPDVNRPSIGDRWVTFDEITHSHLNVLDPATMELFDLLSADQRGRVSVGGESLSGRLLTFYTQDQGSPRIGWAELPS